MKKSRYSETQIVRILKEVGHTPCSAIKRLQRWPKYYATMWTELREYW